MPWLCKLIDAVFFAVVEFISRLLNIATGGSGREFLSPRLYEKHMKVGGNWTRAMGAVDWLFSFVPSWSGYSSDQHCKDAFDAETLRAYKQIEKADHLRVLDAFLQEDA